jgi:CRP-like cAMP-binding protein
MTNLANDVAMCTLLAEAPLPVFQQHCPSADIESFAQDSVIYQQGQRLEYLYCVLDGQIKVARLSRDGAEFTTGLLTNGELFGAPIHDPAAFQAVESATVKGAAKVLRIRVNEFRTLLLHQPAVGLRVVEQLDRRRLQMERRLECFAFARTESRLVETLRELSGGFEARCEHGFGQHIQLSQQELADLVGATRPVVSTILNRLRKEGVLGYTREYVCIRGIEAIEQMLGLVPHPPTVR